MLHLINTRFTSSAVSGASDNMHSRRTSADLRVEPFWLQALNLQTRHIRIQATMQEKQPHITSFDHAQQHCHCTVLNLLVFSSTKTALSESRACKLTQCVCGLGVLHCVHRQNLHITNTLDLVQNVRKTYTSSAHLMAACAYVHLLRLLTKMYPSKNIVDIMIRTSGHQCPKHDILQDQWLLAFESRPTG